MKKIDEKIKQGVVVYFYKEILSVSYDSEFSVLTAIIIAIITLKNRSRIDAIIGMMWASGMAIGIIFVDLTPGIIVTGKQIGRAHV